MTNGQSPAENEVEASFFEEAQRERVTVRRRRAREGHDRSGKKWIAASRSRRRAARTFAVCAGVLLLMAIGLYFGLAHQENAAPAEGAKMGGAARSAVGVV